MGFWDRVKYGRCFQCKNNFNAYSVPKWIKTMAPGAPYRKVCTRCYTSMGGKPRVNKTTPKFKADQEAQKRKDELEKKRKADIEALKNEIDRLKANNGSKSPGGRSPFSRR